MSPRLPDFVDPWHLAGLGKGVSGQVELARLPRLDGALMSSVGHADVELQFDRDEKRRVHITGTVCAHLALECQRCLEQMDQAVDVDVHLVVIEAQEEAAHLPEDVDPMLAEGGRIGLIDLIEEELLLSIPQVPRHPPELCSIDPGSMESVAEKIVIQKEMIADPSPFAVLAGLKPKLQN